MKNNPLLLNFIALMLLLSGAAACNTMEGIGRDLKSAGNAIERGVKE